MRLPESNLRVMRTSFLLLIMLFFASCSGDKWIAGEYYKAGSDFKYSLTLNKDHTFLLKRDFFDGDNECKGKWRFFTKDSIVLNCEKENVMAMLSSGYMNNRVQKVLIVGKQQIKIGPVILIKR
jgi:hypothetical protein